MALPVVLESELRPGWYITLRTKTFFGWAIRVLTRSEVDHAVLYLGDGEIAEATIWGTRIGRLDSYRDQLANVNGAEGMTDLQRVTVCVRAKEMVPREYDWGAIAVCALRLAGFRSRWLLRLADDKDADICSELVAAAGQAAGLDGWLCGEPEPAVVMPSELNRRRVMRTLVWEKAGQ